MPHEPNIYQCDFDLQRVILSMGEEYDFQIVGESFHQDHLEDVAGGKNEEQCDLIKSAILMMDSSNPNDPMAIAVFVDNGHVGYVPGYACVQMRSELAAIVKDRRPVFCAAKIVGGWDRGNGDEGSYGVRLNIARPLSILNESA